MKVRIRYLDNLAEVRTALAQAAGITRAEAGEIMIALANLGYQITEIPRSGVPMPYNCRMGKKP